MLRRFLLSAVFVFISIPAVSQEVSGVFNQLAYRKVAPGQFANNVSMVRKWVLPAMQAQVDSGAVSSWTVWRVAYPIGGDYDLISVVVVDDWAKIGATGAFRAGFDNAHGSDKWDTFQGDMQGLSTIVRTEIWERIRMLGDGENPDPYIRVNFVKNRTFGDSVSHLQMTDQYLVNLWKERLKSRVSSWEMYDLREPGSAASPHNRAFVLGFESFADAAPGSGFAASWARANPGTDIAEIFPKITELGPQVRQESWALVMQTE